MVNIMKIKPKKHYVNNQEFLKSLIDYREMCKIAKENGTEEPKIPNYIGECFMKIAEGLSHSHSFVNYTYRDEMVADGIENCLMYFRNFDETKSEKPFSYFTQIVWYAFVRRIHKERKQTYVKYKATQQMGILDETELLELEDGTQLKFDLYDNISEFIKAYEDAKQKKKAPKKAKGLNKFIGAEHAV